MLLIWIAAQGLGASSPLLSTPGYAGWQAAVVVAS
jgi:hypothetical protein